MTETPPSRRALEQRAWVRRTVRSSVIAAVMIAATVVARLLRPHPEEGDVGTFALVMVLMGAFWLLVVGVLTHPSSGWAGYKVYDGLPGPDRRTVRAALRAARPVEGSEVLAVAAHEQAERLVSQGRQTVVAAALTIVLLVVGWREDDPAMRWLFGVLVPVYVAGIGWSLVQARRARAYLERCDGPR